MSIDATDVANGAEADDWESRLSRLHDVPLRVAAQLGQTRLAIKAVLDLRVGQVVALDRQVGSPVDILANEQVLVARGEVVEVDGQYGVRITELLPGALD